MKCCRRARQLSRSRRTLRSSRKRRRVDFLAWNTLKPPFRDRNAREADADEALQAALPALESAAKALEELDKKDITEVKGMASPPPPVTIVCMCVVILRPLGKEDESQGWTGAKAMMSDVGFMRALQEYKKENVRAYKGL